MSEEKKDNLVTVTIDGQEVKVQPGSTIIQAAKKINKFIPHFCYHEGLSVVGQCRMCFVEVEGMRKLATACSQPVNEGMIVKTDTEMVKHGQNSTLEFILLNHPLDCPICDRGGECKLQDYTMDFGPPRSRMVDDKVLRDKHRKISADVYLDQERCILCTRCVRFSSEVDGQAELVVNNRGNANVIDVFEGKEFSSNFSGNVVDLCPVGALTATDFRFKARPWELKKHEGICSGCSVGCNVEYHTLNRHPGIPRPDKHPPTPRIQRLVPRKNYEVNQWWMCDKGRWGYHFHNDEAKRLRNPLLKREGSHEFSEVSLKEIQLEMESLSHQEWEFWIDDNLPHEGISWVKELRASWTQRGRKVSTLNPSTFGEEFLKAWGEQMNSNPWATAPADWSEITNVICPFSYRDLEEVAPILALKLGQKVRNNEIEWHQLESLADLKKLKMDQHSAFLMPVPKNSDDLKVWKAIPKDIPLLILWTRANSRGLLNEGIVPLEALSEELTEKNTAGKSIFFFAQSTQNEQFEGVVKMLESAKALMVADSFNKDYYKNAHAILPLMPLYETSATLTNLENRQQHSQGIRLHHPNTPSIERGGEMISAPLKLL